MNKDLIIRPCQHPDNKTPCDECKLKEINKCIDYRPEPIKRHYEGQTCPVCSKVIIYFYTEKKWFCKDHGLIEDPEKEIYEKVVGLLKEQFNIK